MFGVYSPALAPDQLKGALCSQRCVALEEINSLPACQLSVPSHHLSLMYAAEPALVVVLSASYIQYVILSWILSLGGLQNCLCTETQLPVA